MGLKAISEVGNGLYFFIENNEVISESFADALGGLLTTFAQNIEIKLQAAMDGYRIVKVRSKKKHQVHASGASASITVGDLQSEEVHEVLLQIALPGETPSSREQNEQVRDAVLRADAIDSIEEAVKAADRGDFDAARERIRRSRATTAAVDSAMSRMLMADYDEAADGLQSTMAYRRKGAKMMKGRMQSHQAQRSNFVWSDAANDDGEERDVYSTSSKKAFRAKAKK